MWWPGWHGGGAALAPMALRPGVSAGLPFQLFPGTGKYCPPLSEKSIARGGYKTGYILWVYPLNFPKSIKTQNFVDMP